MTLRRATPLRIPQDVRSWLTDVFRSCNERVSAKLSRTPTEHEGYLDLTFIEQLTHFKSPFKSRSNWLVRISTHYLGGGRHFGQWEIADIGILVNFRRGGHLLRSKVGLLQSKRLYPDQQAREEDQPSDYLIGFGRLFPPDEKFSDLVQERQFTLSEDSEYRALTVGDRQYELIAKYEADTTIPIYYLLYNPWRLPWTAVIPVQGLKRLQGPCEIGCRVLPAKELRASMKSKKNGHNPTYAELVALLGKPFTLHTNRVGWRLEHFVVDLLLDCKAGYIAHEREDSGLVEIFSRRTGPIAAAIAVTIDAPD